MRRISCFLLIACVFPMLAAADLRTLTGKNVEGELVAITDKEVIVAKDGKRTSVPFAEILQIDLQKAGESANGGPLIDVELTDGTLLHCKKVAFKGKEAQLSLLGSEVFQRVPLQSISSILNGAQDTVVRQEWQEKIISKRSTQDRVVIRRDSALNALQGTLGDANDAGQIEFSIEIGGQRKTRGFDLDAVQGLVFLRTPAADAPSPLCKVVDLNQNTIIAAKLQLNGDSLKASTVAGPVLELPRSSLVRLDFTNDKIAYLSDMTPASLTYRSPTGRNDPPRMDTNLDGKGPLQVKGEVFTKGLAIHAYTELTYNLDGKYKKLEAVLGMDDVVGGDGQPRIRIEGDGRGLFGQTVSRKDDRQNLDLDVHGVRQLRVIVSSAKPFGFEAHVDLANAKLSK
ncbi:MAG TPA: NPCBM/NEW2 domain-containing protein [Gemmataceae bacterium]|nr:NPCBM/NEW2 domain-containing protein [Gemmataceae bacterium]